MGSAGLFLVLSWGRYCQGKRRPRVAQFPKLAGLSPPPASCGKGLSWQIKASIERWEFSPPLPPPLEARRSKYEADVLSLLPPFQRHH